MAPRIHFLGACGAVTGSCYLLEVNGKRVLVDCGLFQGSKSEKELNYRDFPFDPAAIEVVLLTHAHIDHTGLLPKLVKHGFSGTIYSTPSTIDLCSVMLPDSGHIQETEVEQLNLRNRRRGREEVSPIYTEEDAKETLNYFHPVTYKTWIDVVPGMRTRYWNAGHLLGSASIEVIISEQKGGEEQLTHILFSGDIGPDNKFLQPDPEAPQSFDYVLCESTYGNKDHIEVDEKSRRQLLCDEIKRSIAANGALLIPSFAVERTQELLVDIHMLMEEGLIPQLPVFVDSPLATKASQVFRKYANAMDHSESVKAALNSPWFRFIEKADDSRALSRIRGPHIIIAASGMADAGRIRHHLKNWLWRPEGSVLFVGYQAIGSLGRILLDGAQRVRIQGDEIRVRASIRKLDVYSGHADGSELAQWVRERFPIKHNIFLVHGEPESLEGMKKRLMDFIGEKNIVIPALDDCYNLTANGGTLLFNGDNTVKHTYKPKVAQLDWSNDMSRLFMDISDQLRDYADEKNRAALLRRLRRALEEENGHKTK